MATSKSGTKNVGSYGKIRVLATVSSQSIANNRTNLRVRGYMALRTNVPAFNNNGVTMRTSTTQGGGTHTENNTFNISSTSWKQVINHVHTINHAASGNRSLTAKFQLGSTGTTTFGTGGTASTGTFSLPRIPRKPNKVSKPSVSGITASKAKATWAAPAQNGGKLERYQVKLEGVTNSTRDSTYNPGTTRSRTFTSMAYNARYRVRVRARNQAGWGAWSSWTYFWTKAASPNAPNNVDPSFNSDTSIKVGWNNRSTTARKYEDQRVQRSEWSNGSWGSWSTIATVSGTASSYTDTSVSANRSYRYRIQARNESGSATSSASSNIRTTPAAPTDVEAMKNDDGDIEVTFDYSFPSDSDLEHEIQDNPGGEGWETVGTTSNTITTFVHTEPDAEVTHTYRVRTRDLRGDRASAWSEESNTIQLLTPPDPPTLQHPVSENLDRDSVIEFSWRHNSIDTTEQSAFELEWREVSASEWETVSQQSSNENTPVLPTGETSQYEWRVRTKGSHEDWSEWSDTKTFRTWSRPEVTISSPDDGGTIEGDTAEVEWSYSNEDGDESRWEAELIDAENDTVIETESKTASGSDFHAFKTVLENHHEYEIRVRSRSGNGIWSEWDSVTFETDFPLPVTLEPTLEWNCEDGSVSVSLEGEITEATYEWRGDEDQSPSDRISVDDDVLSTNYWPNPKPVEEDDELIKVYASNPQQMEVEYVDEEHEDNPSGKAIHVTVPLASFDSWMRIQADVENEDINEEDELMLSVYIRVSGVDPDGYRGSYPELEFLTGAASSTSGTVVELDMDKAQEGYRLDLSNMLPATGRFDAVIRFNNINMFQGTDSDPAEFWIGSINVSTVDRFSQGWFDGDTEDDLSVEYVNVERDDGSGWLTLARELDPGTTITDNTPRMGRDVYYRVESVSPLGIRANGQETPIEINEPRWHYLSWGDNFSQSIRVGGEDTEQATLERVGESRHWAGRRLPRLYLGDNLSRALTYSFETWEPPIDCDPGEECEYSSMWDEIEALGWADSEVCYRTPWGRKAFTHVSQVSVSRNIGGHRTRNVSVTMEEVDFDETEATIQEA